MSPIEPGEVVFECTTDAYTEWYIVDLIWKDEGVSAILSSDHEYTTVDADELHAALGDESSRWVPSMIGDDGSWIPHPKRCDVGLEDLDGRQRAPKSPKDLTFEKIEGTGSRVVVNTFLEGADDGLVSHELGGVSSWKAAFVARYDGAVISAITLHHYHPSTNGIELAISRLANHASAPANTSSWMIAKARKYVERMGYERLATYAGVGANSGVCYQAAGFEKVGEPELVDGKDWKGEKGGEWLKQKYVYELEPSKYADKSPEWAVETVTDCVTVPGRKAYSAPSLAAAI